MITNKTRVAEPATQEKGFCGMPGCRICTPHKVCHWYCEQCGNGPFKFQAADPPLENTRMKVGRPFYTRAKERYDAEKQTWIRWTRYICSKACYQQEQGDVYQEMLTLQDKRPDLVPAVKAEMSAIEGEAGPPPTADDLALLGDAE